jgi:ATP-dependent Clp protease adapter protein ClpS
MVEVKERPKLEQDKVDHSFGDYAVKAYNNDTTPFDRVMGVFIISCGYDEPTAFRFTTQIHKEGISVCYWGAKDRCQTIVDDFARIGVKAEVIQEK